MSLRPAGKTLSSLTGIVVLAAVLWLLLNFVYAPSCGRFSCSYIPSWWPQAQAAGDECPGTLQQAATDEDWLRDRIESISGETITTGVVYDEDGEPTKFVSGQDAAARTAVEVGHEVGAFPSPGSPIAVDHVELKVAAAMRRGNVKHAILVINKPEGPCDPDLNKPYSCINFGPQGARARSGAAGVLGGRQGATQVTTVHWRGKMTLDLEDVVRRSDLAHADTHDLRASGVFQFSGATYSVRFQSDWGLGECLDLMMSQPRKPATPRLYLSPEGYKPPTPEWPPSNLRFDFDLEHGVAAAVCLVWDKHEEIHTWMTRGDAGRDDVLLTHDSWNPDERRFPPESFITIPELRELVAQWAFGDVLPPPAVRWAIEPHDEVGWL